jgi:NAD(P)-dependent dehydrogenase (short-subunit alcohol dehydrogenase family)
LAPFAVFFETIVDDLLHGKGVYAETNSGSNGNAYMYAKKGIRCNAICPGTISTEISSHFKDASQLGNERLYLGINTNSRSAEAVEIANIAVFLGSDDSSFVNGTAIVADGGWTAY